MTDAPTCTTCHWHYKREAPARSQGKCTHPRKITAMAGSERGEHGRCGHDGIHHKQSRASLVSMEAQAEREAQGGQS